MEKIVSEHAVTTAGVPTEIRLSLDISGKVPIEDVNDVMFVYAQLFDSKGDPVPINGHELNFSSTGDVEIIYSEKALTEQGKAAILIRIGKSLKNASIQVSSIH